ncbi:sigma E protease regulator RseP [Vibrio kasasachensis]|uniref:sigma E protease regulator RseP n=1 Tax=Vibrio kasasachensis TaxID=2910248 RepID=UPI003D0CA21B
MSGILWDFVSFIVALGILVTVHEFGHFWVARRCGVKVERFSIGFGKSIWRKVGKDGTEYTISIIPLGGYVKMLDGRVDDVPQEMLQHAFDRKPLWQRTSIVAAGPIFNFLFAIFAYWLVFLIGVPAVKPVVGPVVPYSIAAQAGLESGMELKAISGVKTADWESVNMRLVSHIGEDTLTMSVVPPDSIEGERLVRLDISNWQFDPENQSPMSALGFRPYTPEISLTLQAITEGSAGDIAGLLAGDKLLAINDQELQEWQQLVELVRSHPNRSLSVDLLREGAELNVTLIPQSKELNDGTTIGFAGIAPEVAEWPENYRFDLQFGVFESIGKAVDKTGQIIDLTMVMLKKLIVGDVGLNNLSGPITIAKGAGTTADYGLVYFLGFLALISVNLGIINLVPLPMLDGGHLLFFAIEAIIRRPVPEKIQEMGYRFGGVILFSLMAVAIFNDFARL